MLEKPPMAPSVKMDDPKFVEWLRTRAATLEKEEKDEDEDK